MSGTPLGVAPTPPGSTVRGVPVTVAPERVFVTIISGWERDDVSNAGTSYGDMFFVTQLACGYYVPAWFTGELVSVSFHCTGAVGGTTYEVQAFVQPSGGALTATGMIATATSVLDRAESSTLESYPVNPNDLLVLQDKRVGALNARRVVACITLVGVYRDSRAMTDNVL